MAAACWQQALWAMRYRLVVLILSALFASATPIFAAPGDDIGAAVRIVNVVTAEYASDERRLATGDNVRQDDLIEVSGDGTGEIRLRDDTQLALGPGSRLLLDEFVYNPDISGGAIVLNLVKGAFRFVTGTAAKPAYVIRTPSAAITVRGTIFDVYVQASGLSWLLLIEGAIEVCNDRGDCGLHDEPGKLIRITPDGDVGNPVKWASLQKDGEPFEAAFPFVVEPPSFEPDPVFTPEDIVGGDVPDPPAGGKDEDVEEASDGGSTTPPPVTPPTTPLKCWNGWKEVPKAWSDKGWRVKPRRRGGRVIYCAHPVAPPSDDTSPSPKPECSGGTVIMLKTLPPRWRCTCPSGTTRHQTGRNAYVCKTKPVDAPTDPKADCLRKGWRWTGKRCVEPDSHCPKGYAGKPPLCVKPPGDCPKGYVGAPPNCRKPPPINCPKGYKGRPPNCTKVTFDKCPKGYAGRQPNCTKLSRGDSGDKLKNIKRKLDKLKFDKLKTFKKD
jgi:FecR-like protein